MVIILIYPLSLLASLILFHISPSLLSRLLFFPLSSSLSPLSYPPRCLRRYPLLFHVSSHIRSGMVWQDTRPFDWGRTRHARPSLWTYWHVCSLSHDHPYMSHDHSYMSHDHPYMSHDQMSYTFIYSYVTWLPLYVTWLLYFIMWHTTLFPSLQVKVGVSDISDSVSWRN